MILGSMGYLYSHHEHVSNNFWATALSFAGMEQIIGLEWKISLRLVSAEILTASYFRTFNYNYNCKQNKNNSNNLTKHNAFNFRWNIWYNTLRLNLNLYECIAFEKNSIKAYISRLLNHTIYRFPILFKMISFTFFMKSKTFFINLIFTIDDIILCNDRLTK